LIDSKSESCDWDNNQMLESKNGNRMRINIYEDFTGFHSKATAECSKIIEANNNICGATVHIVDRVIFPAKNTIIETIDSMEKFTIIRKILKTSGLEKQLQKVGSFTLLAPNDETFYQQLSERDLMQLINDPNESKKFIRLHILPEIICCSGVNNSPLFMSAQQIRTIGGSIISAHRNRNGRVRFGSARVTNCDIMANNGLIHVINKIVETQPQTMGFTFEQPSIFGMFF